MVCSYIYMSETLGLTPIPCCLHCLFNRLNDIGHIDLECGNKLFTMLDRNDGRNEIEVCR